MPAAFLITGELKKMRSLLSMSGGPLSSQGQGSSSLYTKGQVHSSGYDPGMAGKLVVRHADFTEAVSRIQPSVSPAQVCVGFEQTKYMLPT
jgi:hypothetical protein